MTLPQKSSDIETPMVEPASIARLRQEMNRRLSLVREKVENRVIKVLNRHAITPGDRHEPDRTS